MLLDLGVRPKVKRVPSSRQLRVWLLLHWSACHAMLRYTSYTIHSKSRAVTPRSWAVQSTGHLLHGDLQAGFQLQRSNTKLEGCENRVVRPKQSPREECGARKALLDVAHNRPTLI